MYKDGLVIISIDEIKSEMIRRSEVY
jgi:hypothetical protein